MVSAASLRLQIREWKERQFSIQILDPSLVSMCPKMVQELKFLQLYFTLFFNLYKKDHKTKTQKKVIERRPRGMNYGVSSFCIFELVQV